MPNAMIQPKISIITVAYNSAATIEETIQSVISQSYPHKEYIIVDGASTDNTMEIVNKYKDHIDRIISEPDRGISDAFNKGIALATGDLIGIINSDDHLLPETLEKVAACYDGETQIYKGDVMLWDPTTGYKCREVSSTHFPLMPFFCHVSHAGMFVTADCYKWLGGYDVNIRLPMDLDFVIRATKAKARFKKIDVVVAEFRGDGATHANSILHKRKDYFRVITNNGGNLLHATIFFSYLVATQYVKKLLDLFGGNIAQRLRYRK